MENDKIKYSKKYDLDLKKVSFDFDIFNLSILSRENEPKPPSIVWRLFLMFRFEILSASAIKMLSDVIQFANPFFLKFVVFFSLFFRILRNLRNWFLKLILFFEIWAVTQTLHRTEVKISTTMALLKFLKKGLENLFRIIISSYKGIDRVTWKSSFSPSLLNQINFLVYY